MPNKIEDDDYNDPVSRDENSDEINAPEIDDSGKVTRRAITSARQAHSIAKRLIQDNDERNRLNSKTIARYNGEDPFDREVLKQSNQAWRNNFSSKPMSGPVDRSATEFTDFVNSVPKLTNSKLPEHFHRAYEKSELFQNKTTALIRSWAGWNDFVSMLIKEVIIIGYGSCAWLDDNWRPRFYRSDEIFYPDGVGQTPDKVQVVAFKWSYLIHDFWGLVSNRKAAEAAGWHYENCLKAINEAKTDGDDGDGDDDRKRVDAARDFNTGSSYEKGSKSVDVYMVIATEIDGRCSLWITRQSNGDLLRKVDDHYENMADVIGMMTMNVGSSGGYYNSVGIGRMIVNPAYALDRTICFAMDQLALSGLVVVTTEGKSINNVQLRVSRPFVFLSDEKATVQSAAIRFDHAAFMALYTLLQEIIQQIAGVYIPAKRMSDGEKRTATEASIDASREDIVKQGVINRIWVQLGLIISAMQRKIYSPENIKEASRQWKKYEREIKDQLKIESGGITGSMVFFKKKIYDFIQTTSDKLGVFKEPETHGLADQEAVECIVNLLASGLSEKELLILAHSAPADAAQESQARIQQARMAWLQANMNDPMINRTEAMSIVANTVLGEEMGKRVIMTPERQSAEDAAQWRQQAMELATMFENQEVPVVASDNHAVHQRMIREKLGEMEANMPIEAVQPQFLNALKMVLNHHHDHTQFRLMLGETEKDMQEEVDFDKRAVEFIGQIEARIAQLGGIQEDQPAPFPAGTVTPDMIVDGPEVEEIDPNTLPPDVQADLYADPQNPGIQ